MTPAPAANSPLTRERHAELVAYLIRNKPRAWRVIFAPTSYIYDDRDHLRSIDIETRASDLRIRFNSETDWQAAMEIIRALLRLDASACRMSIGSRIDGVDYYGEYAGADAQ